MCRFRKIGDIFGTDLCWTVSMSPELGWLGGDFDSKSSIGGGIGEGEGEGEGVGIELGVGGGVGVEVIFRFPDALFLETGTEVVAVDLNIRLNPNSVRF